MSEQANTALAQTLYAGSNSGDIQSILAKIDQHAEWVDYGPAAVPHLGDFTGRIADFFKAIGESTIGGSVTVDGYIASDDIVVTLRQHTAIVRTIRAKIDAPIAHVFTLHDGTSCKGYVIRLPFSLRILAGLRRPTKARRHALMMESGTAVLIGARFADNHAIGDVERKKRAWYERTA